MKENQMADTPENTNTIKQEGPSRLREITAVLAKHKITRGITPEKLRLILEDLGPTYIKIGQIMSLHSDILPKRYCDELMKLNSDVTPMPFQTVSEVIEHSYRTSWKDIFSSIDEKPLGSASIAQVHRAKLKSGEDVIIKVQRKGIYNTMARDIRLLHKAAKLLPPVGDLKNLVDLQQVLDEMWKVAQEELDFLKEADNMEEFARNNRDVAYVDCPKLFREYTTSQVLVMEYIDGYAINDIENLKNNGYDLNEIGRKMVNNYIKQIMDDGFFHADPHPGNVKIRSGRIIWIDMGMMGRLSEKDRRLLADAVDGIAANDIGKIENAVLGLGDFWGKPDRESLYQGIRDLIQEYGNVSMGEIDIAEVFQALMETMKENKVGMPHGLTMLARGLTHMEGVLSEISPDINMIEIAAVRIREEFFSHLDWKKELTRNGWKLYRSIRKGSEIPGLASDIMHEYLRGQARVNMELKASRDLAWLLRYLVRNIVIGLWVTALLIASSIICTTDMNPKILDIPWLGFIGFTGSIVIVAYVVLRHFLTRKK